MGKPLVNRDGCRLDRYILHIGEIHFAIQRNTFCKIPPPAPISLSLAGEPLVNRGGAACCGRSVPLGGVYRPINIQQPTPGKKNGKAKKSSALPLKWRSWFWPLLEENIKDCSNWGIFKKCLIGSWKGKTGNNIVCMRC